VAAQKLLREVDRAAANLGVRVNWATVHPTGTTSEAMTAPGLTMSLSASGPYRSIKNLLERTLQSDPRLALDRVVLTRNASGDLDAEIGLHLTRSGVR
jgi:hypothetical protein